MASVESYPLSGGTCVFTLTLNRGWIAHFLSPKLELIQLAKLQIVGFSALQLTQDCVGYNTEIKK